MNVIKSVAGDNRCEYKCFDVLRSVILDENVNRIIGEGIVNGEITGFDDELWQKIHNQNIRGINNFEDVFRDGANIGYCTVASKQVSYSFNSCYICGGILPLLIGTRNCTDGSHTWIECDGKVIDTTLMLIMSKRYANMLGYIEENRYDPNLDPIYRATKEFTNDSNLKKH